MKFVTLFLNESYVCYPYAVKLLLNNKIVKYWEWLDGCKTLYKITKFKDKMSYNIKSVC